MSTFKVGQRVRIVVANSNAKGYHAPFNGCETTITAGPFNSFDGPAWRTAVTEAYAAERFETADVIESCLIPLTDPKADAFIESLKRLSRERNVVKEVA